VCHKIYGKYTFIVKKKKMCQALKVNILESDFFIVNCFRDEYINKILIII
jgi:hypothetical protein